jgi:hypothetical protein
MNMDQPSQGPARQVTSRRKIGAMWMLLIALGLGALALALWIVVDVAPEVMALRRIEAAYPPSVPRTILVTATSEARATVSFMMGGLYVESECLGPPLLTRHMPAWYTRHVRRGIAAYLVEQRGHSETLDLLPHLRRLQTVHLVQFHTRHWLDKLPVLDQVHTLRVGPLAPLTDMQMARLVTRFPRVRLLHIARGTGLTDIACESLSQLMELEELSIGNARFTDGGAQSLSSLPRLTRIELDASRLSGRGLERLMGNRQLRALTLRGGGFNGHALAQAGVHRHIVEVDAGSSALDDEGLKHLVAACPGIRKLSLNSTRVTDAGLVHLAGLSQLQRLELATRGVTDGGLAHFKAPPNLLHLKLSVYVSLSAADDLRAARPGLIVDR